MEAVQGNNAKTCYYSPSSCIAEQKRISDMCFFCKIEQAKGWPKPY